MLPGLIRRFLREPDKRLLAKFLFTFGWKSLGAIRKFQRRLRRGDFYPAFLFISVTDRCNLRCQGCWVSCGDVARELDVETIDRVIGESRSRGVTFFGLLGGEPLLHRGLLDVVERHPGAYFQLFTNGTLITDDVAERMRRLGNVTPLVSVEGSPSVSDVRRGGSDVWERTMRGIETCRRHGLITGVATSVCRSNIEDLASDDFIRDLIDRGVLYLWYYIYRPVGPEPCPELSLSPDQIHELREFIVDRRTRWPIVIVDAYWDHRGRAMCPAAVGIAHHVGPGGDVEACPPIQFASDRVGPETDVAAMMRDSRYLRAFREKAAATTRGCILLEDPEALGRIVDEGGAVDSSGRGTARSELAAMSPLPSHHQSGREVPERHWFYRFAKKRWFFGFGAYG